MHVKEAGRGEAPTGTIRLEEASSGLAELSLLKLCDTKVLLLAVC